VAVAEVVVAAEVVAVTTTTTTTIIITTTTIAAAADVGAPTAAVAVAAVDIRVGTVAAPIEMTHL